MRAARRPRHRRAAYLWFGYLLVGTAATVAYLLRPTGEHRALLFAVVTGSAAMAIVLGMIVHRPAVRLGWALLVGAQVSYSIGDTVAALAPGSPAVEVGHLGRYLLLAAGLLVFIRRRTPGGDLPALLDAAVLAIPAGLLWWVYLVAPAAGAASGVAVVQPVLDLLLLVVALRLVLGVGARTAAYRLLTLSLLLLLCTDALAVVIGASDDVGWVDGYLIASYLTLGAAGLHPSMRWLDRRANQRSTALSGARLCVLVLSALLPVLLLVAPGGAEHVPVVAGCSAVLVLLVVARLLGVVRTERRRATVDPVTELYTDGVFRATVAVEAERAARTDEGLAVLLISVDQFGLLAGTYGEPAADLVLCELTERLRRVCRRGDLLAKAGPDRFAVLLPGLSSVAAGRFAELVRETASDERIRLDRHTSLRVTVAVGVAALPSDGVGPEDLFRTVREALDTAATAGGNRTYNRQGPVNLTALALRH